MTAKSPPPVAALYDTIWQLELPPVKGVAPPVVRLVYLAMAKHVNFRRDGGELIVWPTAGELATLTEVSERQVQRVLDVLTAERPRDDGSAEPPLVHVRRAGLRGGRGRRARPAIYQLRPDRGSRRSIGNDTGVATNNASGIETTPARDGNDTGAELAGVTRTY